jgi:hypothetical protein
MLRSRDSHNVVERARTEQTTDEWKQRYATRVGVEGSIHQVVATTQSAVPATRALPTSSPPLQST